MLILRKRVIINFAITNHLRHVIHVRFDLFLVRRILPLHSQAYSDKTNIKKRRQQDKRNGKRKAYGDANND